MIIYGVVSGTSIAELFIAGIGPGLLILRAVLDLLGVSTPSATTCRPSRSRPGGSGHARCSAALWPLGFPAIIIGGIYGGIFSPTEAAAACVLYALLLELVVFRSMELAGRLPHGAVDRADHRGGVHSGGRRRGVLVGDLLRADPAADPRRHRHRRHGADRRAVRHLDRLLHRLHVRRSDRGDPGAGADLRARWWTRCGLDPVLVGTIITLQVAIGSATPPFGCDIFTAIAVFKRPYAEVVRGTPPFVIMLLGVAVALIFFPQIALFLRDLAFR